MIAFCTNRIETRALPARGRGEAKAERRSLLHQLTSQWSGQDLGAGHPRLLTLAGLGVGECSANEPSENRAQASVTVGNRLLCRSR